MGQTKAEKSGDGFQVSRAGNKGSLRCLVHTVAMAPLSGQE